jgi:hypothetical protein
MVHTLEIPSSYHMGQEAIDRFSGLFFAVFMFCVVKRHAQPCEVGRVFTAMVSVSDIARSSSCGLYTDEVRHHATGCQAALKVQPKPSSFHVGSS